MKTDIQKRYLVKELRKMKVPLWTRVAEELERPTRNMRSVNLSKISEHAGKEIILVPGKVLATGSLDKKVTIAAFKFSMAALNKIKSSGKAMSLKELMKSNPTGKGIKIIG